jgi:hypothetical protein
VIGGCHHLVQLLIDLLDVADDFVCELLISAWVVEELRAMSVVIRCLWLVVQHVVV